jgi:hypothetical protein
MPVPTTTLQVAFVSESADFRNTFGWYNRATGYGGILFANVEAQGGNAPLTPGVSTANFTVNTADLANIAFFLVSDGYDLNRNDADDFTGAVKVIQLANGTWAVADVDSHGNVKTDHGAPDILKGEGVNALFTETSKKRRPCRLRIRGRRIEPDRRNADGRYRRRTHGPAGVGGSRRHPPEQRQLYQAR